MQMKHSKVIIHTRLCAPRLQQRCRIPKLKTARFDVEARFDDKWEHWFNSEAMVENNFGQGN